MMFLKHFITIFILFWVVQPSFSQNNSSDIKTAKELLKKAGQSFLNLESKKSLDFAKSSLEISLRNDNYLLAAKAYNLIGLNFDEFSDYKKDPFSSVRGQMSAEVLAYKMPGSDKTVGEMVKDQEKMLKDFYGSTDNPIELTVPGKKK